MSSATSLVYVDMSRKQWVDFLIISKKGMRKDKK